MSRAPRKGLKPIEQTTRQNLCQLRGLAFRRLARAVLTQLLGAEAATGDRVRLLAKDVTFQELVGQAVRQKWGTE